MSLGAYSVGSEGWIGDSWPLARCSIGAGLVLRGHECSPMRYRNSTKFKHESDGDSKPRAAAPCAREFEPAQTP